MACALIASGAPIDTKAAPLLAQANIFLGAVEDD